ncbi:MAG: SusC/RagA family TonB-linked outer membrane protein [Bacteroidetes bacterium]|nr:SusC/RagA family TonB-linked outer membrane protein [Bacteroidota bacterium]MCL6102626.1 SusC/RagA family TonB-linked outer membrane protein [Bacteroidota bacterium]
MISKKYSNVAITLICLLLGAVQLNAQSIFIVRGKVSHKQTGASLPGVTVIEKNRDNRIVNGVVSDQNGTYQIKVADKADSLYFSMIGMETVKKAIAGRELINVTMSEAVMGIKEVTVVGKSVIKSSSGGFIGIAPRDQTAAVTTVDMKNLEEIPSTSIDQVLEGQVPGLLISMNSGDPGSGSSIQIRGATSLGLGTKPLIVVDEVPFKTNEIVDVNNPEGLSELVNISPGDIASIEVLKDAAATSLYGSDGANGVIVIKTKRGDNIKPRVNITSTVTIKIPQRPLPLLNGDQYKTMVLEAYQHRFGSGIDLTTSTIRNLFLEKDQLDYENYNNNTYWPGEINMKTGLGQNFSGSIIGGGEWAKYNVSLGYLNETGPVIGTKFNRVSGRFNFDYKLSDKLSFNSDVSYVSDTKTSSYENIGDISLRKAPILPVYSQDNYGNPLPTYFFPSAVTGFQGDVKNPVALARNALSDNGGNRLDVKVQMRYAPLKGLQINSLFATAYEALTFDKFLPHSASGADYYKSNNYALVINNQVNAAYANPKNAFSLYFKNDFIYRFNIKKHTFIAGLYTVFQDNSTRYILLNATNTPSEYLKSPYLTVMQNTISSTKTLVRDFSVVGQFYYLYGDRYAISGSVRRQGNSAFGKHNRYGTFPAISGFWRPMAESFLKDKLKSFDEFKIRGSYGITGRPPSVSAANAFTFSANAPFADMIGITPDNIELTNLRWEKTTSSNIGSDISILKGRVSTVADFSVLTTRDLILGVPISNSSGFETMIRNFGTIRARVLEGGLTGVPLKSKKWTLTLSANISTSVAKVVELPNNEPVIRDNVLDNGRFLSLVNVGDQVGTIYGLKYLGVYSYDADAFAKDKGGNFVTDLNGEKVPIRWMNPVGEAFTGGDAIYADLNHDGIINKQDVTAIGNTRPDFYGGLWLRLRYLTGFELFANFIYQYGFDIINMAKMNTTNMYTNNNQTLAVMRRWRKQGDVTDIPRALYGAGHNFVSSDRYVEDGSFIKCSTLSLSYNLERALLDKLKMRSAKLAFTLYNVGLLTKYSGVDPTVSANSNDPFNIGKDMALTPLPITYTLSMWLNF